MLIFATAGLQPTRPDPVAGEPETSSGRNDSSGDWGSGNRDYLVIEPAEMQAMPRKKEEGVAKSGRTKQDENPAGRRSKSGRTNGRSSSGTGLLPMTLFCNHVIINTLDCFVPRNDERLKTSFPAVWRHAIPIANNERHTAKLLTFSGSRSMASGISPKYSLCFVPQGFVLKYQARQVLSGRG